MLTTTLPSRTIARQTTDWKTYRLQLGPQFALSQLTARGSLWVPCTFLDVRGGCLPPSWKRRWMNSRVLWVDALCQLGISWWLAKMKRKPGAGRQRIVVHLCPYLVRTVRMSIRSLESCPSRCWMGPATTLDLPLWKDLVVVLLLCQWNPSPHWRELKVWFHPVRQLWCWLMLVHCFSFLLKSLKCSRRPLSASLFVFSWPV